MAIAVNSRVRPKLTSAAFTGAVGGLLQPQPPLFGLVSKLTGSTADIVTEQGDTLQADTTFLDEITAANSVIIETYLDKIVVGTTGTRQFGNAYVGRVVGVFNVNAAPRLLIKSLTNGMYYEMSVANVQPLKDR